ncbi:MYC associated factor X [Hydra vulgaris]|uniref:Protein max n=1 Tax=Hydra vulgaris TaxID=6087 RepID=D0EM50_HYDVU|nr:MYC associated factor X [Hydra vulgaris]ACX32069.1 Max [Hydra vulgaris]
MSDEDKEVDVESGEEDYGDDSLHVFNSTADKRAHHNALERKRRDHIKDSFTGLRDSVPSLEGEKSSRAQILHKATEHIQYMRRKNHAHQADIDELKRHNMILDQQVRQLEKARASGNLTLDPSVVALFDPLQTSHENLILQTDNIVKCEPIVLERPNNTSDHDDYTIAPKRVKTEH